MKEITRRKRGIIIFLIILAAIIVAVFVLGLIFVDDRNVDYENFSVKSDNVAGESVTGLKIAHLSDLHFPKIRVDIGEMLERLKSEKVDFIAITGDIVDRTADVNTCGVSGFAEKLVHIAPVYYVGGNHEKENAQSALIYNILRESGIAVLENESVSVSFGSKRITIMGLKDNTDYSARYFDKNTESKDNYKVLLSHRPEKWNTYIAQNSIVPQLVLSGHAHGGQVRVFGQGLVAPAQGIFPKYDAGLYTHTGSYSSEAAGEQYTQTVNMVVSRGIGGVPLRFNNKPNVPIITVE